VEPWTNLGNCGKKEQKEVTSTCVVFYFLQVENLLVNCDNFQSVTAFGRMMIELTKKHVEEMFTISNGYEHDAQVSQLAFFD